MEELLFTSIMYTIELQSAHSIIWSIQRDSGKEAAEDWMVGHLSRLN